MSKQSTGRLEQAQEEERLKLHRELHKEFGQTIAAALVKLNRIQNEMIDNFERFRTSASTKTGQQQPTLPSVLPLTRLV